MASKSQPRIVCRSAQLTTVQELVALGLGISIVPEMCARADRSTARHYRRLGAEGPEREIAVIWRRGRSRSLLARAFVDELRAHLERRIRHPAISE
jgi:LysR family hydrogen peroxide-inducible transcriptional activator